MLHYGMDGLARSQGIEWNIFGRVAPRLNNTGGFMILDTGMTEKLPQKDRKSVV